MEAIVDWLKGSKKTQTHSECNITLQVPNTFKHQTWL